MQITDLGLEPSPPHQRADLSFEPLNVAGPNGSGRCSEGIRATLKDRGQHVVPVYSLTGQNAQDWIRHTDRRSGMRRLHLRQKKRRYYPQTAGHNGTGPERPVHRSQKRGVR